VTSAACLWSTASVTESRTRQPQVSLSLRVSLPSLIRDSPPATARELPGNEPRVSGLDSLLTQFSASPAQTVLRGLNAGGL